MRENLKPAKIWVKCLCINQNGHKQSKIVEKHVSTFVCLFSGFQLEKKEFLSIKD